MKVPIRLLLVLLGFIVCFVAGWLLAQPRDVIVYEVNGNKVAFHHDWPTYGLPLAEYSLILDLLKDGELERLERNVVLLQNLAVEDAMIRLPLLDHDGRIQVERALKTVGHPLEVPVKTQKLP